MTQSKLVEWVKTKSMKVQFTAYRILSLQLFGPYKELRSSRGLIDLLIYQSIAIVGSVLRPPLQLSVSTGRA